MLEALAFRDKAADWIEDWIAFAGPGALDDQVRFDREWAISRRYALDLRAADRRRPDLRRRGLGRHAAHPEDLSRRRRGRRPAGRVFTDKGQLWGNPVDDWPALRRSGYAWWIARFRRVFELFDLARIDHFRGFVVYWGVPASAEFALEGA